MDDRKLTVLKALLGVLIVLALYFTFLEIGYIPSERSEDLYDLEESVDSVTTFQYAFLFFGVREFTGRRNNNPKIVEFLRSVKATIMDDETPWCSAFINYVAIRTGYERSGSLLARSWLKVGRKIDNPVPGDVVILWRSSPRSWKGHVGFFLRFSDDGKRVLVYGGNQLDRVTLQWYPSYRILGFRRLRKICDGEHLEDINELFDREF